MSAVFGQVCVAINRWFDTDLSLDRECPLRWLPERRSLKFYQANVFTSQPFGGNPVAVFPEAEGSATMSFSRSLAR